MGKKDDFVLDTRKLCFLCYRPARISSEASKVRVKDKTFSLRSISRFMDVDFQKMAKSVMPDSGSTQGAAGGKFPQVLVTICSRCSAVTDEFTQLYMYLEFTQMKINACVRNLKELMTRSDSNPRLLEKFHKKMMGASGGSKEVSVVENIRKEIMINCSLVLQNALPRVRIRKFGVNVPRHNKVPKWIRGAKPGPRSKKPGFSSTILKTDKASDFKNILAINKDDDDDTQIVEKITGGIFQCLHCDHTFNDTSGLRVHIVRYHPEQFFSMFKNADVSEDEFKVAVQLLFRDVRKITTNNGGATAISFICTCCGKPFSAKIDTYMHMVQLHHDVLSTKLQSVQKDKVLMASAKRTIRLPDTSTLNRRGPRGPYKVKGTKKKPKLGKSLKSAISNDQLVASSTANLMSRPFLLGKKRLAQGKPGAEFSRVCECGVVLSSKSAWHNHQNMHCKLRKGTLQKVNNIPATTTQHSDSVLKRAKNSVGFPRTCACGVRLSLRTSWTNHQRLHCKLKFGTPNVGIVTEIPIVTTSNPVYKNKRKKMKVGKPSSAKTSRGIRNRNKYTCECGSVLNSYSSWYYHTKKACKLKNKSESNPFEMDWIEEIPIDITPSGDLCLPSASTSIETSPVPKIMNVVGKGGGGVIKGLHRITNFQTIVKKEEVEESKPFETESYSKLFSKFLPPVNSLQEIETSLQKVLQDYRKFPGNISGCPYCGRGFTQVPELHSHMVESHFDELLMKLRNILDPSGIMRTPHESGGIINVDPSLVKTENEIETNVFSNDLNVLSPETFQSDPLNEKELENSVPKEEPISFTTDETSNENDPDQLLILP